MRFKDKVVFVTGAGRGIGAATALDFAREGAKVALAARSDREIEKVALDAEKLGATAIAVRCDVTSRESVFRAVERAREALGPIDILVNNAGLARFAPILEASAEDWDAMYATNSRALLFTAQAVLPEMMERKSGRIITIASSSAHKGYVNQSGYVASKHAALGFSKVLALETQKHGIRVHVVNPGGVDTRLVRDQRDDVDFSEYMRPEDVSQVVLMLAEMEGIGTVDEVTVRRERAAPWG